MSTKKRKTVAHKKLVELLADGRWRTIDDISNSTGLEREKVKKAIRAARHNQELFSETTHGETCYRKAEPGDVFPDRKVKRSKPPVQCGPSKASQYFISEMQSKFSGVEFSMKNVRKAFKISTCTASHLLKIMVEQGQAVKVSDNRGPHPAFYVLKGAAE